MRRTPLTTTPRRQLVNLPHYCSTTGEHTHTQTDLTDTYTQTTSESTALLTGVAMCWSAACSSSSWTTSAWSSCAAMYRAVKPAYHTHTHTDGHHRHIPGQKLVAIILSNRNRFSKFFTGRFSRKRAVTSLLKIPPRPNCIYYHTTL